MSVMKEERSQLLSRRISPLLYGTALCRVRRMVRA